MQGISGVSAYGSHGAPALGARCPLPGPHAAPDARMQRAPLLPAGRTRRPPTRNAGRCNPHQDGGATLKQGRRAMPFAIKAAVCDPRAETFAFTAQKTMYGGKHIAEGDTVFVFASENEGGQGLIAQGVVTSAEAVAKKPGLARQTPRVSLTIRRTALAKRPLGRRELRHLSDCHDGQPGTELNFKFYRQATTKIA